MQNALEQAEEQYGAAYKHVASDEQMEKNHLTSPLESKASQNVKAQIRQEKVSLCSMQTVGDTKTACLLVNLSVCERRE